MSRRLIIAIIDTLAKDVAGNIMLMPHEAIAVRFFSDVMNHPQSEVRKHAEDYHLAQLGVLEEDLTVSSQARIIMTGSQWVAAQTTNTNDR